MALRVFDLILHVGRESCLYRTVLGAKALMVAKELLSNAASVGTCHVVTHGIGAMISFDFRRNVVRNSSTMKGLLRACSLEIRETVPNRENSLLDG